jgi:hypothetical protein
MHKYALAGHAPGVIRTLRALVAGQSSCDTVTVRTLLKCVLAFSSAAESAAGGARFASEVDSATARRVVGGGGAASRAATVAADVYDEEDARGDVDVADSGNVAALSACVDAMERDGLYFTCLPHLVRFVELASGKAPCQLYGHADKVIRVRVRS